MLHRDSRPKDSSFNERFHLALPPESSIVISKAFLAKPKDSLSPLESPHLALSPEEEIKRLLNSETPVYQKSALANSLRERISIRASFALYLGTFDANSEVRQKSAEALLCSLKNLSSLDPALEGPLSIYLAKTKHDIKGIRSLALNLLEDLSPASFSSCILDSIAQHEKSACLLSLKLALIHYHDDKTLWHSIRNLTFNSPITAKEKQDQETRAAICQNALLQKEALSDFSATPQPKERNPLKRLWKAFQSYLDCHIKNPRKLAIQLAWHFYGSYNLYQTEARIEAAQRLLNLHLKKGDAIGERLIKHFDNWVSIEDILLKGLLDRDNEVRKTCAQAILTIREKSKACWQQKGVPRSPYLRSLLE